MEVMKLRFNDSEVTYIKRTSCSTYYYQLSMGDAIIYNLSQNEAYIMRTLSELLVVLGKGNRRCRAYIYNMRKMSLMWTQKLRRSMYDKEVPFQNVLFMKFTCS